MFRAAFIRRSDSNYDPGRDVRTGALHCPHQSAYADSFPRRGKPWPGAIRTIPRITHCTKRSNPAPRRANRLRSRQIPSIVRHRDACRPYSAKAILLPTSVAGGFQRGVHIPLWRVFLSGSTRFLSARAERNGVEKNAGRCGRPSRQRRRQSALGVHRPLRS